jgi:uncharacterized membrane protein
MHHAFDWRTVLLARHAQHVVLIHFPIALYIAGWAFDLLSRGKSDSQFEAAAYLNFSVAAIMVVPVVITGLLAWQFALEGQRLKGILLLHLVAGSVSALVILATWWGWRRASRNLGVRPARGRLVLETAGVLMIGLTAHLGGFLSGVNA